MKFSDKITLLNSCINEWFVETGIVEARPKDLMKYLIQRGVYNKDHREGLPLRNDLRRLKREGRLNLIDTVEGVEVGKNTQWYFRVKGK